VGEYITGSSPRKRVLAFFCLVCRDSFPSNYKLLHGSKKICIASNLHLTNFFDLSNIRPFAGGPEKMFGASRCFRKMPFQFDGQPALGADLPFGCDPSTQFISHSKEISLHQQERHLFTCLEFRFVLSEGHGIKG
jgi:hypothetical protein